jgi:hypothetical protein
MKSSATRLLLCLWLSLFSGLALGGCVVEAGSDSEPETEAEPDYQAVDELSSNPVLAHQGDFLTNPDCPSGTTGYVNASSTVRAACRAGILERNYTHHYVSITSETANWFTNVAGLKTRLQELVSAGIRPVVFLTSDTGAWKDKSISAIKADLTAVIPQINALADSYVLGIEIDEYWTASEAKQIGDHMQTLTTKKIAAHQLSNKWTFCKGYSWCDYMILQYGFGKTASQISSMTKTAIADLGKPLVAGEYNLNAGESTSVTLGNAAVTAGAAGFGNGGGSPSTPPQGAAVVINSVSTGKAYAIGHAEVSNVQPYIDRTFTITTLSAALDGQILIRTANDDKNVTTASHLKFTVKDARTVYVAYSGTATAVPTWLSGWTLTSEKLDMTDTKSNPRKLYKKAFAAGAQVTLGGNRASGVAGPTGFSNYVVVVK